MNDVNAIIISGPCHIFRHYRKCALTVVLQVSVILACPIECILLIASCSIWARGQRSATIYRGKHQGHYKQALRSLLHEQYASPQNTSVHCFHCAVGNVKAFHLESDVLAPGLGL